MGVHLSSITLSPLLLMFDLKCLFNHLDSHSKTASLAHYLKCQAEAFDISKSFHEKSFLICILLLNCSRVDRMLPHSQHMNQHDESHNHIYCIRHPEFSSFPIINTLIDH